MASSPHRSAAAADRPPLQLQPSLLPPFEPLSSSPTGLPKTASRKRGLSPASRLADRRAYPTPVPTSSTALPTSSPSRPSQAASRRPPLHRTASTLSERAPLGELPTAHLPANGTPILFGRSTNSSHFQLSSNRFISRIHVEAFYELPSHDFDQGRVLIKCLGWNGARVKYQGESHFLEKGHSCAFTNPHTELMLDVQDARVILRWPPTRPARNMSEFSDASAVPSSPSRTPTALLRQDIPSSPPVGPMLHSPISPSPRRDVPQVASDASASASVSGTPGVARNQVQVFEDSPSDKARHDHASDALGLGDTFRDLDGEEDMRNPTQSAASLALERASQNSSVLSDAQDFSDNDEENDPVVLSFGPFGANLLPRLASLHAASPSAERRRAPLQLSDSANHSPAEPAESLPAAEDKPRINLSPIRNHVINQLAFSRVHSLPLGTIFTNLPGSWRDSTSVSPTNEGSEASTEIKVPPVTGFTREDLKKLLDETAAVGEIVREGKDAAGKALEDEFYYVPELDTDTMRRNAVQTSLGKTGMRAVRKQHKQYYWKRPRY